MRKETEVKIGDTYGRLTIISEVFYKDFPSGQRAKFVDCECSCGKIKTIRLSQLTSPKRPTISCGCYQVERSKEQAEILEIGRKFNRLSIVENLGMKPYRDGMKNYVLVACVCGSEPFEVRVDAIKSGNTNSCGCYHKDQTSKTSKTHGMSKTSAYSSWQGMKDRCNNPNSIGWDRYGGRGISYDPKWTTFEGFWEDMEEGWSEDFDIDRINFNGNYCKDNCRWVERDVGNHNKSKPEYCTSKYKGVYYDKSRDKWVARLNRNNIVYLHKRFNTEIEAATEYDNCSEEVYGDRPNKTKRN